MCVKTVGGVSPSLGELRRKDLLVIVARPQGENRGHVFEWNYGGLEEGSTIADYFEAPGVSSTRTSHDLRLKLAHEAFS